MGKILFVDDDLIIAEMFSIAIKKAGYEVDVAGSGSSAYDLISKNKYDMTILDMMMPGMSGIELISKMSRENKEKNMGEVIVLTSLGKDVIDSRLQAFKIETYLDKSEVTPNDLVKRISEKLSK